MNNLILVCCGFLFSVGAFAQSVPKISKSIRFNSDAPECGNTSTPVIKTCFSDLEVLAQKLADIDLKKFAEAVAKESRSNVYVRSHLGYGEQHPYSIDIGSNLDLMYAYQSKSCQLQKISATVSFSGIQHLEFVNADKSKSTPVLANYEMIGFEYSRQSIESMCTKLTDGSAFTNAVEALTEAMRKQIANL